MNRLPNFLSDPLLRPLYESFGNSTLVAWHEFTVEAPRFEFDPPVSVAPPSAPAPAAQFATYDFLPLDASFPADNPPLDLPPILLKPDSPLLPKGDDDNPLVGDPTPSDLLIIYDNMNMSALAKPVDPLPRDLPQTSVGLDAPSQDGAVVLLHDGLTLIL